MSDDRMNKIVSLAKRRGFVYPGSEIYGGLANTWDYGPLGARLLQNIRSLWWKKFIDSRSDIFPIESALIMNPKVWEASGHIASFTDPLVECKTCHARIRADKPEEMDEHAATHKGETVTWTEPKNFNLMFQTFIGSAEDSKEAVYLRPETAQGMFVNFKNVLNTERPRIPFGIAQIGKAFRNEITPGNFIFRTLEFELMEIEYFVKESDWEPAFEGWKSQVDEWLEMLGIDTSKIRWRRHEQEELSHYSSRTEDVEFEFPWGWGELYGLAYRTDFDLKNHSQHSGEDLLYTDPETGEKFIPHVVEPAFGLTRTALVILLNAYTETEDGRVVLKLNPKIAPYKVAVFPLVSNKPDIVAKARDVFNELRVTSYAVAWDDRGNIGKRYAAQDEIGTPWCVTIDYDTLQNNTVTVRDRDTSQQERIAIDGLASYFASKLI